MLMEMNKKNYFPGFHPIRHLRRLRLAYRTPHGHLERTRLDVAGSNAGRRPPSRRSKARRRKVELGGSFEHLPEVRTTGSDEEVIRCQFLLNFFRH
jgi:hypothetical protein